MSWPLLIPQTLVKYNSEQSVRKKWGKRACLILGGPFTLLTPPHIQTRHTLMPAEFQRWPRSQHHRRPGWVLRSIREQTNGRGREVHLWKGKGEKICEKEVPPSLGASPPHALRLSV